MNNITALDIFAIILLILFTGFFVRVSVNMSARQNLE